MNHEDSLPRFSLTILSSGLRCCCNTLIVLLITDRLLFALQSSIKRVRRLKIPLAQRIPSRSLECMLCSQFKQADKQTDRKTESDEESEEERVRQEME